MHWRRTPALTRRLREGGFHVMTVVRHPLDVLLSVLQFCLHDDSTMGWLGGEAGDERPIRGAMPGSAAFLDYAVGPRAAALLAVGPDWAADPDCILVRYEELVADAPGELRRIAEALGEPDRRSAAEVAAAATLPAMRARTGVAHHFWQGRPGLWRALLTAPSAGRIAEAHRDCFAALGYVCDPDPELTPAQADANWLKLVWPQTGEKLRRQPQAEREARRGATRWSGCGRNTRPWRRATRN